MRNPGVHGILTVDGKVTREDDGYTCAHCNGMVMVKPKQRPEDIGGWCRLCAKAICPRCAGKGRCDPFERKLDALEGSRRARASYGI
jgi:hypothetical protein